MKTKLRWMTELIAAVGVMGSLLFVGMQVRQANLLARLQVQQEHAAQFRETNLAVATSPELSGLFARVYAGAVRADFEPGEVVALDWAYIGITRAWEQNYRQLQLGVLGPDDITYDRPYSQFWTSDYFKELWATLRPGLAADFASFWTQYYGLSEP
jgi:hypothetical protein